MAFEGHFGTLETFAPFLPYKKSPPSSKGCSVLYNSIGEINKVYHLTVIVALIVEQSVDYNNNRYTTNVHINS
jgi:hypothetical protein